MPLEPIDGSRVVENQLGDWAIVELMGHRRLAGLVTEVERFGNKMLRLDVPNPEGDGFTATQFYSGASLYCVTPTTEQTARAIAKSAQPAPVTYWEVRQLQAHGDDERKAYDNEPQGDE